MPALKCPNPSCPFLFDPTQVPPGALLTCPRCGMRFTLGPTPSFAQTAPAPPSPDLPPPGYGPGVAPAMPLEAAPPLARPAVASPVERDESPERTVPRRDPGGGIGTILAIAGGSLLLLGVIAAIVVVTMWSRRGTTEGPGTAASELVVADKNFAFRKPGPPWVDDADARSDLGVNVFAMRRSDGPKAWIALAVSDYATRSPMPHEMRAKMRDQLGRVFLNLPPELTVEDDTWAGHAAQKCLFRGEHKTTGEVLVGEVHMLSHRGVGYWFYAWAPEADAAAVADELAALRNNFRTLDERPRWKEQVGPEIVYRAPNGRFKLSNYEKIWERPQGLEPKDEDPKAELLLKAELKGKSRRDLLPTARLVALVLDRGQSAGDYVRKRNTPDPEIFGPTQITEITSEPVGDPAVGPELENPAAVTRLKVSPGGANAARTADKLVVYASIETADGVVVAEGSCPWGQREVWERRLIQLVGSLRP